MTEAQDNRLPVRIWLRMASLALMAAVALALVTGRWGFLWYSLPVVGLLLVLGGIRSVAQVRERAAERAERRNPGA